MSFRQEHQCRLPFVRKQHKSISDTVSTNHLALAALVSADEYMLINN